MLELTVPLDDQIEEVIERRMESYTFLLLTVADRGGGHGACPLKLPVEDFCPFLSILGVHKRQAKHPRDLINLQWVTFGRVSDFETQNIRWPRETSLTLCLSESYDTAEKYWMTNDTWVIFLLWVVKYQFKLHFVFQACAAVLKWFQYSDFLSDGMTDPRDIT